MQIGQWIEVRHTMLSVRIIYQECSLADISEESRIKDSQMNSRTDLRKLRVNKCYNVQASKLGIMNDEIIIDLHRMDHPTEV